MRGVRREQVLDSVVKGCEPSVSANGQVQKNRVPQLIRSDDSVSDLWKHFRHREVQGPELMIGRLEVRRKERSRVCDLKIRFHDVRVRRQSQESELGIWAGRPALLSVLAKPGVRGLMMDVRGPSQCDKEIHVQQADHALSRRG